MLRLWENYDLDINISYSNTQTAEGGGIHRPPAVAEQFLIFAILKCSPLPPDNTATRTVCTVCTQSKDDALLAKIERKAKCRLHRMLKKTDDTVDQQFFYPR
jgi:hypothetical protein